MTLENIQTAGTISQIQRSSAHSGLQAIASDYYNITDANGAPLAGLLVLMDRKQRPVRAELHLHDTTLGASQELAQRQARLLLGERYVSAAALPLNIFRMRLEQERVSIPLQEPPPTTGLDSRLRLGLVSLVVVIGLVLGIWGGIQLIENRQSASPAATAITAAPVATDAVTAEGAQVASPASDIDANPATTVPTPITMETNGLPVSRNALPMEVGQQARIRPGFALTLRTEPGAFAGEEVGYLEKGAQVQLIGGPIWMQGNSDTIVWWYVRMENGQEAWAPANDSNYTLLEPAQ